MSDKQRKYDVVLLGASGFTGRLVAEYLLQQYGVDGDLTWAMAGRNREKLQQVRSELTGTGSQAIPILIADSNDAGSLADLAAACSVICTTVGPYALFGSGVVEACVNAGTHYCDLTGEVQWMRRMIAAHQAGAEASGAKIVHTCGFDSIPSDLGVFFLQQQMIANHGVPARHVRYRVQSASGGFSGGTVASMLNMMDEVEKDPAVQRVLEDPYALLPSGVHRGDDQHESTRAAYDDAFECWTIPFVMAGINTRVVRRSNALLDFAYGEDFRYDEAVLLPQGRGSLTARVAAFATSAGTGVMTVKPLRKLAQRWLPAPGEGPDRKKRERGSFDIRLYGHHPDDPDKDMCARVTGDRDPGYGSTSKMLAESAVCLARDDLSSRGGIWTPASGMGQPLVERLIANAGLTFDIE